MKTKEVKENGGWVKWENEEDQDYEHEIQEEKEEGRDCVGEKQEKKKNSHHHMQRHLNFGE